MRRAGFVRFDAASVMRDDEYQVLRATIQQRGTARMVLIPLIFVGWAGTAVATAAVITVAVSTLVPLLILVAGFEAVFALHVNVERIGRDLHVFHDREVEWELVSVPDPLFSRLFVLATSVNFLPAALGWENIPELVLLAALHLLFINRVRVGRIFAARQCAEDLERFATLKREGTEGTGKTNTEERR
jgi:hypothetical protein